MIRNIAAIVLVFIWMSLIFFMSNSDGASSGSLSGSITSKIIETFTDIDKDDPKYEQLSEKLSFIIRKMAHFIEYFILGILVMNMMFILDIRHWRMILSVLIVILYAMSDELHQVLVDGREGNITDVLIDSSAGIIATYLYHQLIIKRFNHEKGVD